MEGQKQFKNIGTLKGKLLVFGGVYSNLQALQRMQEIAKELNILPSDILCTGDVVGYCAQPEKVVQSIIDWGIHCIAGNVELQLREGEADCGCNFDSDSRCNVFSKQWYPYSQSKLSKKSIDWMHTLPDFIRFNYANKTALMLHGSLNETAEFIFKSSPWNIKEAIIKAGAANIILAGHCGLPFNDIVKENFWLNAGVIGMPANDGTARVWYMILDDADSFSFEHHSFVYDNKAASSLMQENNLPQEYAKTLLNGLWDNCEILPVEETSLQGNTLVL